MSLKVIWFRISGKPRSDNILPYNNYGLISKGAKNSDPKIVKIVSTENLHFWPSHFSWCLLQRTTSNISIKLTLAKTTALVYIFVDDSMRHSRSLNQVLDCNTNCECFHNFLLVINSLYYFRDKATYWPKITIFLTPSLLAPLNFWMKLNIQKPESWDYQTVKISWP